MLYEDDGHSAAYRTGAYTTIQFTYDPPTLTIGARAGEYAGMWRVMPLHVVRVREGHGTGLAPCAAPDRTLQYTGERVQVTL